jgi:methyl-accepting chemotaxis protein
MTEPDKSRERVVMPTDVSSHVSLFDRFAGYTAQLVSRAPFFALAVGLVVVWLVEGAVMMASKKDPGVFLDQTYQLQINTLTTIVTFLLVALLQNSQTRSDNATQEKLNAIADGLGDLMAKLSQSDPYGDLKQDVADLTAAVGLENIVSADEEDDNGDTAD